MVQHGAEWCSMVQGSAILFLTFWICCWHVARNIWYTYEQQKGCKTRKMTKNVRLPKNAKTLARQGFSLSYVVFDYRCLYGFIFRYINKQLKINAVTLTHKDFSELFRATNEQLLIRFRNYWATQQQQKRTVKRRYYKNLIVVFSYRILSFFTFTPPIQNTPRWTVNIWTNEHWGIVQMN